MHHHGLSEWAVVCFTVNVIMGSGFLDVPHAMMESGLLLGIVVLVVVTILQWLAACMLAEVVARSHALLTKPDYHVSPALQPLAKREYDSASRENLGPWAKGLPLLDVPSETSFEIMALCRLHLGRVMEGIIGFFVLLYLVGTLWSYADVFASALASSVPVMGINHERTCTVYLEPQDGGEPAVTTDPECLALYYTWCGIFATSMGFLCVFELEEQVAFQVFMTFVRVAVIAIMVGTLALSTNSEADFGLERRSGPPVPLPLARPAGLAEMLPVAIFCQNVQIGVPALLQPLAHTRSFSRVFGIALGLCLLMYLALGIATASFFGSETDPSCNLNWRRYQPRWVALMIELFPAIDTFTVFPLNAIFLANNLLSVILGEKWHAMQVPQWMRFTARLGCSIPPIVLAALFPSLSGTLDFTGIVAVILPFIVTPLLHRHSLLKCLRTWTYAQMEEAERNGGFRSVLSPPPRVLAFGVGGAMLLVACLTFQFTGAGAA